MKEIRPNHRLKALRGKRRREAVAAAVGISVSALAAYENGTRNPSDNVKRALASYYGTTVGQLFFGEGTPWTTLYSMRYWM